MTARSVPEISQPRIAVDDCTFLNTTTDVLENLFTANGIGDILPGELWLCR